jgi:hypothetical protein
MLMHLLVLTNLLVALGLGSSSRTCNAIELAGLLLGRLPLHAVDKTLHATDNSLDWTRAVAHVY